jgi:hypothetical protein
MQHHRQAHRPVCHPTASRHGARAMHWPFIPWLWQCGRLYGGCLRRSRAGRAGGALRTRDSDRKGDCDNSTRKHCLAHGILLHRLGLLPAKPSNGNSSYAAHVTGCVAKRDNWKAG